MILDTKEYFMDCAIKQAERALESDEVPIGCVIVHNNKIIAKSYNQTNTLKDPTAHAEMIAITQAADYLDYERLIDTQIYSTVEPCPMCIGAIIQARISKLIYGAKNEKYGACGSVVDLINVNWNHKVDVEFGVHEEKVRSLMKHFFQSKRGGKSL